MAKNFNLGSTNTTPVQGKHNKYSRYLEEEISAPTQETKVVKRINMAFTNDNYKMINEESERFGTSMVYLVNTLIRIVDAKDVDTYIDSLPIKPNKKHVARRKGSPSERINIGFDKDTYSKIEEGSEKYDMTLKQYLNILLDVYTQAATLP